MKTINLTQDKVAFVDDRDFDWLNKFKWHAKQGWGNTYYAARKKKINGKTHTIFMHRLILGLGDNKLFSDHINGNGCDNQRCNLRIASKSENAKNVKSKGKSKYLGVSKARTSKGKYNYIYWRAEINNNGKYIWLGRFPFTTEGEIQAALAYNEAAKKYHGEFARFNVVYDNNNIAV